jgi:hypothetical protein
MSPQVYRLVVDGELGPRYASAFNGMRISAAGGRTEITGTIVDQSHLQGLLERISSLGLTLYSVTPLDNGNSSPGSSARPEPGRSPH